MPATAHDIRRSRHQGRSVLWFSTEGDAIARVNRSPRLAYRHN